jgi:predicted PurR-regulated permease PerM
MPRENQPEPAPEAIPSAEVSSAARPKPPTTPSLEMSPVDVRTAKLRDPEREAGQVVRAPRESVVALVDTSLAWTNRRIFWVLAVGTLIVSLIWHAPQEASYISERTGEIFFVMVMAISFTYLLRPSVNFFNRTIFANGHGGRLWATTLVFVLCGLLLYLFVAVALKPMTRDLRTMWDWFIAQDPEQRRALIDRWQTTLNAALSPYQYLLPAGTELNVQQMVPSAVASLAPQVQAWLGRAFSHAGFIVELLLLPVLVFYFLCDGPAIRREAGLLLPVEWRPRASRMAAHLDRVFDGYIRGQVWMCLIAWIAVTLGLMLLQVPHALTLGLIAGLTRAIPVVGPLLGGIPLVLVCLVTTRSLPITATLLTGFVLMHFLESKVLLPKIIGHEVDLHPVSVIVVLLLGLEFFGFLGVFLAVPVAAVLKIVLTEWHQKRNEEGEGPQRVSGGEPITERALLHRAYMESDAQAAEI